MSPSLPTAIECTALWILPVAGSVMLAMNCVKSFWVAAGAEENE
jgi:hypothetical protein